MDVVIADDEPLARARLRRMVEDLPGYSVIGEARDGIAALRCVREQQPDIVLLDIHMPGGDGLKTAARLADLPLPPAVIFTTAYVEHALSAHQLAAAGYLVKPVNRSELANTLARAQRPSRAQLHVLKDVHTDTGGYFVTARSRTGTVRVALSDVIYFRAEQKYTMACHLRGELLIEDALSTLERRFGDVFLRVHREALVARRYIMALQNGNGRQVHVRLRHCDHRLPVSRRRVAEVRRCLLGTNENS